MNFIHPFGLQKLLKSDGMSTLFGRARREGKLKTEVGRKKHTTTTTSPKKSVGELRSGLGHQGKGVWAKKKTIRGGQQSYDIPRK